MQSNRNESILSSVQVISINSFRISHLPQSHRNHPPLTEVPATRGWLIERVVENSHSTQTKNTYIFELYMLFQPTFIHIFQHTLPETNSSPLKIGLLPPKGNDCIYWIGPFSGAKMWVFRAGILSVSPPLNTMVNSLTSSQSKSPWDVSIQPKEVTPRAPRFLFHTWKICGHEHILVFMYR